MCAIRINNSKQTLKINTLLHTLVLYSFSQGCLSSANNKYPKYLYSRNSVTCKLHNFCDAVHRASIHAHIRLLLSPYGKNFKCLGCFWPWIGETYIKNTNKTKQYSWQATQQQVEMKGDKKILEGAGYTKCDQIYIRAPSASLLRQRQRQRSQVVFMIEITHILLHTQNTHDI